MKMAAALKTTIWQAITQAGTLSSHVITGVATITIIAVCFVFGSMLPSRCQLLIKGPKIWCSRSQLFMRSEDRANAKAATSRNGVVGNKGSTTPTAPIARAARPVNNQRNRALTFIGEVHHKTSGSGKSGGIRTFVTQPDLLEAVACFQ